LFFDNKGGFTALGNYEEKTGAAFQRSFDNFCVTFSVRCNLFFLIHETLRVSIAFSETASFQIAREVIYFEDTHGIFSRKTACPIPSG